MALTIFSFDQISVIVEFTGNFDDYEFAIDGAFTAPIQVVGNKYEFDGLFPGTFYRVSAYNFNGVEPTTEAYFQTFTTTAGSNVPINLVLSNPQVSSDKILFTILDPDTFTSDNISINDGFASDQITKGLFSNQILIIANLEPSTTYSIQYKDGDQVTASYILRTSSVDPPPEPPSENSSSGLSDGATVGIIFGSLFAILLFYYVFYLK